MGLLFDGGAIDDDLNVFAEQHPTGVEWGVEVDSKIFTVNGGGGLHPETGVAVGILGGAGDGDVQGDGLGMAFDSEIPGDCALVAAG